MTTIKPPNWFFILGFILLMTVPAQSQFLTIARKIKAMHTPETDIATVLLDTQPANVYRVISDSLSATDKYQVLRKDDQKRYVEFTVKTRKVSLQVDSLSATLTQITVASPHSGTDPATADLAVEAILRVSRMAGVKCTVEHP